MPYILTETDLLGVDTYYLTANAKCFSLIVLSMSSYSVNIDIPLTHCVVNTFEVLQNKG